MDTKLEIDIEELIDTDEDSVHIHCCIDPSIMLCGFVDPEAEEDWEAQVSCSECDLREIEDYCPITGHCATPMDHND